MKYEGILRQYIILNNMDDITEQINRVPFEQVFMKLGIKTFPCGFWTRGIFDNGKKSDWWKLNEKENLVNDFSGKRPKWDVIKFIQEYLQIDFPQALEYAKLNFTIQNTKMEIIVRKPFKKLEPIQTSNWIEKYLKSRGINLQKLVKIVKPANFKTYWKDVSYNGECIACEMKDMKGLVTGIQYRSIEWKAFHTDGSDSFFYSFNWNKEKDFIFIVEWLTDYLSLRQYTEKVIWFKSCKTAIDDNFKKFIERYKNVYLLFDNDEAGQDAKLKFKEKIDWTKILEIKWNEKIDINDLTLELWDDLLQGIQSYSEVTQTSSNDYNLMLSDSWEIDLNPWRYTWGTDWLDIWFWKFNKWNFNVIVGESSSGKTEYSLFMGTENANRWIKVMFISLEMDTANIYRRLALKKLWMDHKAVDKWLSEYQKKMVFKKIEDIKKIPIKITGISCQSNIENIKKIIRLSKEDWFEMFIIDSLDMIQVEWKKEAEFVPIITRELKELCNKELVNINLIHHFTKWSYKERKEGRGLSSIKGSVKVENNADTIIKISRVMWWDEFEDRSDLQKKEVTVSLMKDRAFGNTTARNIYFINGSYQDNYQ